jgi:hypothetical protein
MNYTHLLFGMAFLAITACSGDGVDNDTVADVMRAGIGEEAEVNVIVTAEPGLYDSFLLKGFGGWQPSGGLYIVTDQVEALKRNDQVQVFGTIEETFGMRVLKATSIIPSSKLAEKEFPILNIASEQFDEYYVGRIVKFSANIVSLKPDLPYGWRLELKDRYDLPVQAVITATSKIDPRNDSRFVAGKRVTLTGLMIKFKKQILVLPRDSADIVFE